MRKWIAFQLGLPDKFKGISYSNITQFYDSLVSTVSYHSLYFEPNPDHIQMTCKDLQRFQSIMRGLRKCHTHCCSTVLLMIPPRAGAARHDRLQRWQLGRHHRRQTLKTASKFTSQIKLNCKSSPSFFS